MQCPSEAAGTPLRVGIVDYLNSRPLAWSFLADRATEDIRSCFLSPAAVADRLRRGELDVGLIPTIELQKIPRLSVVPDLCVAATREVRSVLLLSRVEPGKIRRLALDENSRTSVALVKILLRDLYAVEPETTTVAPDPGQMLADADAALIIGDPALAVDRDAYVVLDLAAEWRRLTGKPFVFAVWAVREGIDLGDRSSLFRSSLEAGLEHIDELITEAAVGQDLPTNEVREYLTENLSYNLGAEELAGLEEFFHRAERHALIDRSVPIRFVRSCDPVDDSVEYSP